MIACRRRAAVVNPDFARPWLPLFGEAIADRPRSRGDLLFWQFPARTGAAAQANHAGERAVALQGDTLHCYVGLPWATFLDHKRADARPLQEIRTRLPRLREALAANGIALRLHTVCPHVQWRALAPMWQSLGLTDAWISHLPAPGVADAATLPFALRPWRLFALNAEDAQRSSGIVVGKDPARKRYLASFIGTHLPFYLSDVRLRLQALASDSRFAIRLNDEGWHLQDVVYGHQVAGRPLADCYVIDERVTEYNHVLSESVFALCPPGAGPNSLRLWEAMAVGAIPVLFDPEPALPRGGTLPPIDWDAIVVHAPPGPVDALPALLESFPREELRRRQRACIEAFAQVREQRCF